MIVGIPKETYPGERRVALIPAMIPALAKAGCEVLIERDAGSAAGHPDATYVAREAKIAASRDEVFQRADVLFQVRAYGANLEAGAADLKRLRPGQTLIGLFEPLTSIRAVDEVARTGATLFALELIPRITRAQSMDVLSAMATVAGYKAVLLAAEELPKLFPRLTTAAGTVASTRVFVVGVGVAGLMAIATARRMGAIVEAYDVRPSVKEQVESVGAKFVEMPVAADAEDAGGYAKAQDESFYKRQRELLAAVVAQTDVVITTAAVPGAKAPVLVSAAMVAGMQPGSVIVDLAAERGGNCELTRAGERVVEHAVTILGPVNLASTVPATASQMFAKNVTTFFQHLLKDGKIRFDMEDEIVRETLVCHDGKVDHPKIQQALRDLAVGAG